MLTANYSNSRTAIPARNYFDRSNH